MARVIKKGLEEGVRRQSVKSEKVCLPCLKSGSASFEGPGLCSFRRRVLQRDLWRLTMSTVVKWDGLAFGVFPGSVTRCSHLYTYVTISATQAHESDNLRQPCRYFLSFFLLFSGKQRILGYVRPRRIAAVHPPKREKRRLHLEEPLNWGSLRMALWCNWPSNASSEGCKPWIETQHV